MVIVLATDASSEIGWGIACEDTWLQGYLSAAEQDHSINWKELRVYAIALERLPHLLRNRLVYIKLGNSCAVRYINAGSGRIPVLADLARSIRLVEGQLGVESVAVHLPGEKNVTADALSRMMVTASQRDRHGDRCLRKRLFNLIHAKFPNLTMDGVSCDDGSNAQLVKFVGPSESFFEIDFSRDVVWAFPPDELIGPMLKFLDTRMRAKAVVNVVILVPERVKAPWFYFLAKYKRAFRFVRNSDLFRKRSSLGLWKKLPPAREPWLVLSHLS